MYYQESEMFYIYTTYDIILLTLYFPTVDVGRPSHSPNGGC